MPLGQPGHNPGVVAVQLFGIIAGGQQLVKLADAGRVGPVPFEGFLEHALHAVVVAIFQVHIQIGIKPAAAIPLVLVSFRDLVLKV